MPTRALLLAQFGTLTIGLLVLTQQHPSNAAPAPVQRLHAEVRASALLPQPPATKPRAVIKVRRHATAVLTAHLTSPSAVQLPVAAPKRAATTVAPATSAPGPIPPMTVATAAPSTPQQRMMAAVARIPRYHTGDASWILSSTYGSWGTADWYKARVYIAPEVPAGKIYDVVSHEWSHLLSVKDYGGDVEAAKTAMNRWFGGSGLVGAERAGDCMARELGAVWTNYTACTDSHWQAGARILVSGGRLPTP